MRKRRGRRKDSFFCFDDDATADGAQLCVSFWAYVSGCVDLLRKPEDSDDDDDDDKDSEQSDGKNPRARLTGLLCPRPNTAAG